MKGGIGGAANLCWESRDLSKLCRVLWLPFYMYVQISPLLKKNSFLLSTIS